MTVDKVIDEDREAVVTAHIEALNNGQRHNADYGTCPVCMADFAYWKRTGEQCRLSTQSRVVEVLRRARDQLNHASGLAGSDIQWRLDLGKLSAEIGAILSEVEG